MWAKVLCVLLTFAQLAVIALALWLIRSADWIVAQSPDAPPAAFFVSFGYLLISMAAVTSVINLSVMFLKPTPVAYIAHLTNMAAGALTIVLLPLVIPLAMQWFKPEVRAYFKVL